MESDLGELGVLKLMSMTVNLVPGDITPASLNEIKGEFQ